ncbi:MAG: PAS domain S-box protein [Desulfobacterales bacterium]|nr:PAS domain S-box protein [Desulfobacterales bacterium]
MHKVKQADKIRRLATALEDSNDAIMVLDPEENILAWNKGAQQMYGWTEAEALKMNFRELVPEDKQSELKWLIEKRVRGEPVKSFKSQRKTKTGKILDVWLTVTALRDESGRPTVRPRNGILRGWREGRETRDEGTRGRGTIVAEKIKSVRDLKVLKFHRKYSI